MWVFKGVIESWIIHVTDSLILKKRLLSNCIIYNWAVRFTEDSATQIFWISLLKGFVHLVAIFAGSLFEGCNMWVFKWLSHWIMNHSLNRFIIFGKKNENQLLSSYMVYNLSCQIHREFSDSNLLNQFTKRICSLSGTFCRFTWIVHKQIHSSCKNMKISYWPSTWFFIRAVTTSLTWLFLCNNKIQVWG